jgi:Lrp/AsnC family transcriptional regulator
MSEPKALDAIDLRILKLVQSDASLPIGVIAHKVGLSQTPCWKRIQRLEATGFIRKRVALLSPEKLGLDLTVVVMVEVGEHSDAQIDGFPKAAAAMPEVMDVLRLAGDSDYLLRVIVKDTAAFDAFYRRLVTLAPLKKVTSRFVLETIKIGTELPL